MTAFTRQNTECGNHTLITSYPHVGAIHNGSTCLSNHNHYVDLQREGSTFPGLRRKSRKVYDRKKTSISIITKSKSSTAILQTTNGNQDKKTGDHRNSQKKRRSKDQKEKGMKMKRLLILLVLFVLYVSLGAVVFNALEAGAEQYRKDELDDFVEQFLDKNSCVNRSHLYDLLKKAVVDSEIVNYVVENKTHLDRWDFSGAFGFVVSVVTTIGFGNMSPFTLEGKVVCVVYALFGIPLTLLVLGGLGEKMASCISRIKRCKNPMCYHTPRVNRMLNVIYIGILGVVLIFIAPAAMFTYVEQWHFMESVYFCFTTLSTIGFGDYVIGIHERRLTSMFAHEFYEVVAYVWILLGLAYLSLVYRYITDTMVAKAQEVGRSTIRRLGPELSKTLNVNSSDSSKSSRSSTPERRGVNLNSVRTENTELICEIELPLQIPRIDVHA